MKKFLFLVLLLFATFLNIENVLAASKAVCYYNVADWGYVSCTYDKDNPDIHEMTKVDGTYCKIHIVDQEVKKSDVFIPAGALFTDDKQCIDLYISTTINERVEPPVYSISIDNPLSDTHSSEYKKISGTFTQPDNEVTNPKPDSGYADENDFIGNLSCGGTQFEFHESFPKFTNTIYDILKVVTPIIVIITGMLDLLKAVAAQKEDEIKKGQQKFLRRILASVVVFLVFVIVESVIHLVAESADAENALDCVDCFLHDYDSCDRKPYHCYYCHNFGEGDEHTDEIYIWSTSTPHNRERCEYKQSLSSKILCERENE